MTHSVLLNRAKTVFAKVGADPANAEPLARWAEAHQTTTKPDHDGVIVGFDGTILAETQRLVPKHWLGSDFDEWKVKKLTIEANQARQLCLDQDKDIHELLVKISRITGLGVICVHDSDMEVDHSPRTWQEVLARPDLSALGHALARVMDASNGHLTDVTQGDIDAVETASIKDLCHAIRHVGRRLDEPLTKMLNNGDTDWIAEAQDWLDGKVDWYSPAGEEDPPWSLCLIDAYSRGRQAAMSPLKVTQQ
jgi:hypothetical protein